MTLVHVPFVPAASARTGGFSVEAGRLADANGNDFVMRGINHPFAWFEAEMGALADIKATGANTARVVVSSGDRFDRTTPDEITQIVDECRSLRLVCVLELHDTTGFPEVEDSIDLTAAADYWRGVAGQLRGSEAHVIINIGNEPFGNSGYQEWAAETSSAVRSLRDADLRHTLMVDAPNWGQDWSHTMRDNAAVVLASDPERNVVFDVHMYGAYESERTVRSYVEFFVQEQLPLVIGEFGATHTDGDPNEDAIMRWASEYGIGYVGWSWSGNVAPVADLNVAADFAAGELTPWGERLIKGDDGIRATAAESSVFGGSVVDPLPFSRTVVAQAGLGDSGPLDKSEAEHGVLNGLGHSVQGAGFSGDGYVNGLDTFGDSLSMEIFVDHDGSYALVFGYRASYGAKTQQLYVNGLQTRQVVFPEAPDFERLMGVDVELSAGVNTIMIAHDWGWIDVDYVEVWAQPEG